VPTTEDSVAHTNVLTVLAKNGYAPEIDGDVTVRTTALREGSSMHTLIVTVTAAAVALVTGCASNTPTPSSTATGSAPPTTVEQKQAPISAFAQAVAEFRPQLTRTAADAKTICEEASNSAPCQNAYGMLGRLADELYVALLEVHSPLSPSYLGAPPEVISSLVSDTEELAGKVSSMASAYELADCPDLVTTCTQERLYAEMSATELVQKLAAWDAHT
jgi:hypothetical protein